MDDKEELLIEHCLVKFYEKSFIEVDVYLLLIMLRQHSKKNNIVLELANFVAHRERNRGEVYRYIFETKNKVQKIGEEQIQIEIKKLFTSSDLIRDINQVLRTLDKQELAEDIENDLMICVVSLLQGVKLVNNNKQIGELALSISRKEFKLVGVVKPKGKLYKEKNINLTFPVLSAKNTFIPQITKNIPVGVKVITTRDSENRLTLDVLKDLAINKF